MFTGIITATAKVNNTQQLKDGLRVKLERPDGWDDLVLGESIAVNGACLTIAALEDDQWEVFLMPETLAKTSFGKGLPAVVNLERAMVANERLSGHIVQGHVDCVGVVTNVVDADEYTVTVGFPAENESLVVYKGSITLNGVSLTVAAAKDNTLTVALIPHTLEHTTLGSLEVGDELNMEFDMIGKYVINFMKNSGRSNKTKEED